MTATRDQPLVSIVITTRDRGEDLLRALASCSRQQYEPIEVVVVDDGSERPVADIIRDRFPQVRVLRNASAQGVVPTRSRGYREASGEIIVSIDDDAEFQDPRTVTSVVQVMQADQSLGAAAIAFTEPNRPLNNHRPRRHGPLSHGDTVRNFVGCAHAVRKSAWLEVGGYRDFFVRQAEERDLCIRLIERGYRIGFVDVLPVIHWISPVRDHDAMNFYGIRNTILFSWLNIPHPYTLPRIAYDSCLLLAHKFRPATLPRRLAWLLRSLASCVTFRALRTPVSRKTYARYRSLPTPEAAKPPQNIQALSPHQSPPVAEPG